MDEPQTPDQAPIRIQVPDVGVVEFPAGTSQADMEAAISQAHDAKVKTRQASLPPRGLLDTALDIADALHAGGAMGIPDRASIQRLAQWLPGGEAAVGSTFGAIAGGTPGAVAMGAIGGGSGEAQKQLLNRAIGQPAPSSPMEAADAIRHQMVVQGAATATGEGIMTAAGRVAPWLMTKAAKPAEALLEDFRTTAPALAKTLLDNGVNVTRNGVEKLGTLLKAKQDELRAMLANSTETADKGNILAEVLPTASRIADQPAPQADLEAIGNQVQGFIDHPKYPGQTLSMPETQALKTGTYQKIAGSYGERGSATVEADKAIARGAKNEIVAAHPETAKLNADEANLMAARDAVAKQVGLAANRDPMGLAWVARNPETVMGWLLEKNPAVKSLVARGLYSAAGNVSGVPADIVRLIVHAVATAPSAVKGPQ